MARFLIDYENEGGRVLEGISLLNLTENDAIILFYSRRASRITMELHEEFERIPAKKLYIKVETGAENALDFQLASCLGAFVHQNPNDEYYIISKDRGYDCVCHFWKSRRIFVERIERFCYYRA